MLGGSLKVKHGKTETQRFLSKHLKERARKDLDKMAPQRSALPYCPALPLVFISLCSPLPQQPRLLRAVEPKPNLQTNKQTTKHSRTATLRSSGKAT